MDGTVMGWTVDLTGSKIKKRFDIGLSAASRDGTKFQEAGLPDEREVNLKSQETQKCCSDSDLNRGSPHY